WPARNVDRWIEVVLAVQGGRNTSDISHRKDRIPWKLSLEAEIPARAAGRLLVLLLDVKYSVRPERNVLIENKLMRTPAGNIFPRIIKSAHRTVEFDAIAERRRRASPVERLQRIRFPAERVRSSQRHSAVARHIPSEAEPRREHRPDFVNARGAVRKAGIAGISETGGRVQEYRALDALLKPRVVESVGAAIELLFRKVRVPTKAGVHRQ